MAESDIFNLVSFENTRPLNICEYISLFLRPASLSFCFVASETPRLLLDSEIFRLDSSVCGCPFLVMHALTIFSMCFLDLRTPLRAADTLAPWPGGFGLPLSAADMFALYSGEAITAVMRALLSADHGRPK